MDRRLLSVDWHWRYGPDPAGRPGYPSDLEAVLVLETPRRWVRLGCFYGEAPGSHMFGQHLTAWYTGRHGSVEVHGWNVRFGRWPQPCVTLLLHTRPQREVSA